MEQWDFIKEAITTAFPPIADATDKAFLLMQEQFLLGEMDCWYAVESIDAEEIIAVMTTKVVREDVTGTKNMLIFSVTSYMPHRADLWTSGYDSLKRYAASKGCSKIVSFTNNSNVLQIAQSLGADIEWHLIQLDI